MLGCHTALWTAHEPPIRGQRCQGRVNGEWRAEAWQTNGRHRELSHHMVGVAQLRTCSFFFFRASATHSSHDGRSSCAQEIA